MRSKNSRGRGRWERERERERECVCVCVTRKGVSHKVCEGEKCNGKREKGVCMCVLEGWETERERERREERERVSEVKSNFFPNYDKLEPICLSYPRPWCEPLLFMHKNNKNKSTRIIIPKWIQLQSIIMLIMILSFECFNSYDFSCFRWLLIIAFSQYISIIALTYIHVNNCYELYNDNAIKLQNWAMSVNQQVLHCTVH